MSDSEPTSSTMAGAPTSVESGAEVLRPLVVIAPLSLLFVLTGATGLLVEQVFEKLLTTVVGASTPAGSLVLAVYFAGLSVGGLGYGVVRRWVRHPILLYGALEGFVAAFAIVLALIFPAAQSLSSKVVHLAGDGPAAIFLLRLVVAAVWIFPPTLAMGATFPAIVGVLERLALPRLSSIMAGFYAANLLGALLGAILGPYVLFPSLGLIGTLATIACVQALIVVVALVLSRRFPSLSHAPSEATDPKAPLLRLVGRRDGRLLIVLAATSGFVVFGLEVVWIHLIGTVIGMSVYAFALMLAHVLGGLFVGGLIATFVRPSGTMLPPLGFAIVLLVAGAVASSTGALWDDLPRFMLENNQFATTFARAELLRFATAFVVTGLPAIALGVVYPLLFRLPWYEVEDASPVAGLLGAANAVGSVTGALTVGFFFLPTIGSEATFHLFAWLPALVAMLVVGEDLRQKRARGQQSGLSLAHVVLAGCVVAVTWLNMGQATWNGFWLTSGVNVYFQPGFALAPGQQITFWHEDAAGGITSVVERQDPDGSSSRTLLTNGKFQGNDTGELLAQVGIGLVPIAHQDERERALVIGLGTGVSARVVASAGYRHVEIAELAPGIVRAAEVVFPDLNAGVLTRPGVELFVEDGRNHLLRTDSLYDLITLEISSIWFAGATNLYSEEFYRLAKSRMQPGGIFQQWIQFHHIGPNEVLSTLATVRNVFASVGIWRVGGQAIIVASDTPLSIDASSLERLRTDEGLTFERRVLAAFGLDVDQVVGSVVLTPAEVDRLHASAQERGISLNTDGNRYLEYASPRYNHEGGVDHTTKVVGALFEFVDQAQHEPRLRALGLRN